MTVVLLVGAGVAALVVGIAVLAARDMDRRGRSGELYAVAIMFMLPLGLVMWGLDRRRPPAEPDPEPGPLDGRQRQSRSVAEDGCE